MVARWLGLLVVVSGCDWSLGLHHFDHGPDADIDGDYSHDLGLVQGTYRQHWIENDVNGKPVARDTAPRASDLVMSRVVLDDGMTRPLTYVDDGTGMFSFTTETPGQRYALEIVTPYIDTVYELDATQLALVERFSGRIDRQQVVNATPLALTIAGQTVTANTKEELHTTGIWNSRPVLAFSAPSSFSLDWSTIEGLGGPFGLLDGSRHDALYYAHYSTNAVEVRLDVTAVKADATIVDGSSNSFVLVPTMPLPNSCIHLVANVGAEATRLRALHASGPAIQAWQVNSHPLDEFAATTRYPLAYAFAADALDAPPNFENPYPGSKVDAEIVIIVVVGTDALITASTVVPIAPDCTSPPLINIALGGIGIPDNVMLNATSLFATSPAIALDHVTPVTVSWTTTSGTASYYIVKLQEVLAGSVRDLVTVVTTQESATFEAKHFTALPTYRIEIVAMTGYPEAASGDFTASRIPSTTITVDTVHFKTQ